MVADLDKSVAFYKAIGFSQDPQANPAWRKDEVSERLYGVKGFQTRMPKMYVVNSDSGQHFVVRVDRPASRHAGRGRQGGPSCIPAGGESRGTRRARL